MRPFARATPAPEPSSTARASSDVAQRELEVDVFVDRYVQWREECEALDAAYRDWARSRSAERDMTFALYRAALDREEQAASGYRLVAAVLEGPHGESSSASRATSQHH